MPADNSMLSTLLMLAVMGLAFWLLLIRPAQRKQKAQQELVSNLGPGTRVMTTAGVMATIRELGERTAVVEISPGVEMTVLKQAIMRTVDAAEEEFEYDDEDADVAAELTTEPLDGPVFDPERPLDPDTKTN
ncbi:preprotein translocase subunit YajC [Propioniciclava sinopodophylli]|jgi:preprotein translocase subunit YajC|uniref:preprotein translocase subunit YajC n=1 Tax=Propioniciclava sinopodophylli TaxID=1837344 RepID=UPI0024907F67|nr:preprotein translocase subunit YajC [Propioniciclava sinopodophylli]